MTTTYYYVTSDSIDNERTSWFRSPEAALAAWTAENAWVTSRDLQPYVRTVTDPTPEELAAERDYATRTGATSDL